MAANERILVVDDEETIQRVLCEALQSHGYQAQGARNAEEAQRAFAQGAFDLALVDLKLPGAMDGLGLLEKILGQSPETVVIMLTAYGTLDSAVAALRRGAYDYLTKPASLPLIVETVERGLAKRRDGLRRHQIITQLEQTLEELKRDGAASSAGKDTGRFVRTTTLMIDRQKRLAVRGNQPIGLTATEFDLLDYLAQHADRVVTAAEVVKEIQGYDLTEADARPIVRVHIQRLRQKLEDDPVAPRYILNVRGKGYRFVG